MIVPSLGIDCQVGYGFNEQFRRFIECNSECQRKKQAKTDFVTIHNVLTLAADNIMVFTSLGYYLEENMLRLLDFCIINDKKKYLKFELTVFTRNVSFENVDTYPEKCDHHVVALEYGMHLDVIVPRKNFLGDTDEIKALLDLALIDINNLEDLQKTEKCRVLVNSKVFKDMTLEELFWFTAQVKGGKHSEYEEVVRVCVEKHKELRRTTVNNEYYFKPFLSYLYTCYRIIEMKLENTGYPLFNMDIPDNYSMKNIVNKLGKANRSFKEMDKNDFFKMYPVMKDLFLTYMKYLKISIDNNLDIDVEEDFLDALTNMRQWMLKLNEWLPIKVNGKWYGPTIDQSIEPVLRVEGLINGVFGYVNMEGALKIKQENPTEFEEPCPLECSDDERKWICTICSDIIKTNETYLMCSCGVKVMEDEMFTCNHPEHKMNYLSENLPVELKNTVSWLKKCEKTNTNYPQVKQEIEELRRRITLDNQK